MGWYIRVLKLYAVTSGRARRKEYWMFALFNLIVVFALGFVEGVIGMAPKTDQSVLAGIYQLAILIPATAAAVRRMHDTNHSGWWLLVPIYGVLLSVRVGQRGDNRFGPDPKTATS